MKTVFKNAIPISSIDNFTFRSLSWSRSVHWGSCYKGWSWSVGFCSSKNRQINDWPVTATSKSTIFLEQWGKITIGEEL